MASNLNSEFNYRYQVIGSTPWEKLKTLKGFLVEILLRFKIMSVGFIHDILDLSNFSEVMIKHLEAKSNCPDQAAYSRA